MSSPAGDGGASPDEVSRDALHRHPDASYARAAAAVPADADERAVISAQLGRPARGEPAVVHRCRWGLPTVVRVAPRLEDGTPFPTTFWLSCPALRSKVGTLEADHAMVGCNDRLQDDPAYAAEYAAAHERYVAFRDQLGPRVPRDPSAGGMPERVKCLHSLYGHHLATDDNPVGAWVADQIEPMACPVPCATLGWDEERP